MTRSEYFQKYKWTAIWQDILYGIPASIELAQGALESDNGNSRLATEGNNHFGIKAYENPFNLPVMYLTDDLANEPFRKYDYVKQSYIDHSLFLKKYSRYASLFNTHDYKEWATGLKAAGYATAPGYATLITNIIEDNNLQKYDWIGKNKYLILFVLILVFIGFIYLLYSVFKNKK